MTKFLLISLITFSVSFSFANDDEDSKEPQEKKITSREYRAEKKWGWVGQFGNFTMANRDTFGFGAGLLYYINGDHVLSVEAGTGTNYDWVSSLAGDTVNGSDSRFGVYDKIFVGNSFYLKAGIEADHVRYEVTHYPILSEKYSQKADIDLYSVFLGLGNHWQIGKLTIGCDWFGVMLPFANANFSETDVGTGSGWDLKDRLTKTGLIATRGYIGMSF